MDKMYFSDIRHWYRFIFSKEIFHVVFIFSMLYLLIWVLTILNSFWFNYDWELFTFLFTSEDEVNKPLSNNDLSLISSYISVFLAISVPMAVGVLTNIDKKYNVGKLTKSFYKESVLKALIIILFTNVIGILLTAGYSCHFTYLLYYSSWVLTFTSILIFFLFVLLVKTYYSDLKHLINLRSNKFKNRFYEKK